MTQPEYNLDQLPDAIAERLKARDRSVSMLTPAVDRAILDAAEAQFARPRARPAGRWYVPAAAAAAVALVALFFVRPFDDSPIGAGRLADDVDGSGQVDILDAFSLARSRQAGSANVNQDRIDDLAARIVSLDSSEVV
ncbi:MAG TPA: hypothetical protein VKQ06_05355, partial [Gammaproteobacteria bacterium]|nr:hypothetical protein [Gammaproteobacteria bacterium]